MFPRGVLICISIVRVGILETIASITRWEGPGVVRRMMMRKEIRERGKKERTNKRRTDIKEENFHAATAESKSRAHLRPFPSVASSSAPLYY